MPLGEAYLLFGPKPGAARSNMLATGTAAAASIFATLTDQQRKARKHRKPVQPEDLTEARLRQIESGAIAISAFAPRLRARAAVRGVIPQGDKNAEFQQNRPR